MTETEATVVSTAGDFALVEPVEPSGCGACGPSGGGCGAMSLGRMFVFSPRRYRALNRADARPGDRVVVAVADGALWRGATAGYLVPLALVLAGAILGARAGGDLVAAAGAGIGLVTGGVWLRLHARRTSAELDDSPVIVRRRENAVLLFKENS